MLSCPQEYLRKDRSVARQHRLYEWRMSVIRDIRKGGITFYMPTKKIDLEMVPRHSW